MGPDRAIVLLFFVRFYQLLVLVMMLLDDNIDNFFIGLISAYYAHNRP